MGSRRYSLRHEQINYAIREAESSLEETGSQEKPAHSPHPGREGHGSPLSEAGRPPLSEPGRQYESGGKETLGRPKETRHTRRQKVALSLGDP
jgi:hypothetical protein